MLATRSSFHAMKVSSSSSFSIAPRRGGAHNTTVLFFRRSASATSQPSNSSIVRYYSQSLETHPILTKSLTSAAIAFAGDVLCQSNEKKNWDSSRSARFAILGCIMVGPGCHYWYGALAKWFPGNSLRQVSWRVIVDQLAFNPPFLFVWLTAFWHMEGIEDYETYVNRMKQAFPPIILANWALWFPVQAFTFRCIPIQFQVLATNCFDLLWNCYLSFSTAQPQTEDDMLEVEEACREDDHTGTNEAPLAVKEMRNGQSLI